MPEHDQGGEGGGLSLDTRAEWLKGGDAGPAIVPGKPEESLLLKAVSWMDLDLQMSPNKKFSEVEFSMLTEWVRRGAHDSRVGTEVTAKLSTDPEQEHCVTEFETQINGVQKRLRAAKNELAKFDQVPGREHCGTPHEAKRPRQPAALGVG